VRNFLAAMTGLVCILLAGLTGGATGIEVRMAIGPAVELVADWDIGWKWHLALSAGVHLGMDPQTPSATIQTPSLMFATHVRYTPLGTQQPVVPYVGLAAAIRTASGTLTGFVRPCAGLRARVTPNLYLLAEGGRLIPLIRPEKRRWDLTVGVGLRF